MTDLEKLLAKDQMREKIYLYARCMDRCDNNLCDEVFTEDCTMDYGPQFQGSARGFCEWAAQNHQKNFDTTSHQYTNIIIKFKSDDEAVSEIYAVVNLFGKDGWATEPGKRKRITTHARYLDRWRRCADGQWRIYERHYCQEQCDLYDITLNLGGFNTQRGKDDIVYKLFED